MDHSEGNELKSEQLRLEHHTKIFASMCPDEILDHYNDYNTRMYYTTLMLGDISGITRRRFHSKLKRNLQKHVNIKFGLIIKQLIT